MFPRVEVHQMRVPREAVAAVAAEGEGEGAGMTLQIPHSKNSGG